MGRVVAPFGVKGWVKVQPYTERPEGLCAYRSWWLSQSEQGGDWREVQVLECAAHTAALVARLEGYEVREHAAGLNGAQIAVPRAALPAPEDNEFYFADLIGLEVRNLQGEALGQVKGMMSNGAHPLMRIARGEDAGAKEQLVPFVPAVVSEVSLAERRIVVDWGVDW